jgi:hypothetical protein
MRESNRRELESLPALRQKAEGIDELLERDYFKDFCSFFRKNGL